MCDNCCERARRQAEVDAFLFRPSWFTYIGTAVFTAGSIWWALA